MTKEGYIEKRNWNRPIKKYRIIPFQNIIDNSMFFSFPCIKNEKKNILKQVLLNNDKDSKNISLFNWADSVEKKEEMKFITT